MLKESDNEGYDLIILGVRRAESFKRSNRKLLEKYKNEYQWLYTFVNSKIWLCLRDYFSVELDTFILRYDFNATLRSLDISEKGAKVSFKIRDRILKNDSDLTYEDVTSLISYLKRSLTHKYKKKLIDDLKIYQKTLPKKTQNESN